MKQLLAGVAGAFVAVSLAAVVPSAQAPEGGRGAGQAPPAPTNLQVLPKDIPRDQLIGTMRGYAAGLGVQCNYCHVQEGRGGRNDMASDEKAPKKTARLMMTMTRNLNDTLASGLGKPAADIAKVECGTCHRGMAIPKYEPPPQPERGGQGGQRPPA